MDTIKESFEKLQKRAKADGAEIELMVTGGDRLTLGFQKQKMEKFESSSSRNAGLRVILGAAQGYASTENLSEESLERSYKGALENARTLQESSKGPAVPLAAPSPLSDEMTDLFQSSDVEIEKKMAVARDLEAKALTLDPRITNVPYSGLTQGTGWIRLLNSRGLDRYFKSSAYSGYSYPLAKEGESTKMDGESFHERDFNKINVDEVVREAVKRATSRLGAKRMKTGVMPVLVDREAASMFLSMFMSYLSAKEVDEHKSLLAGKLGQKVASDIFTLTDDPFDRNGTGTRPFDSEGSPSQKTVLFENGVLKNYLTNLEMAQKMGLPHTASASRSPGSQMDIGASNLIVRKGQSSREQLLKSAPRLLLLTEFSGGLHAGFKEASGDFSMPAEGFVVENGQIAGPVDQFVVSGNILELLKKISAVGDTYNKAGSSVQIPDLLISSLSIAGES